MTDEEHEKGVDLFNFFYEELRRIVNDKLKEAKVTPATEEFVRRYLTENMRFWD